MKDRRVPCAVFSRVVGYLSMVKRGDVYHWHKGKAKEWEDRKVYVLEHLEEAPDVAEAR